MKCLEPNIKKAKPDSDDGRTRTTTTTKPQNHLISVLASVGVTGSWLEDKIRQSILHLRGWTCRVVLPEQNPCTFGHLFNYSPTPCDRQCLGLENPKLSKPYKP